MRRTPREDKPEDRDIGKRVHPLILQCAEYCRLPKRAFADVHQTLSFANAGNWRNERDELKSFKLRNGTNTQYLDDLLVEETVAEVRV